MGKLSEKKQKIKDKSIGIADLFRIRNELSILRKVVYVGSVFLGLSLAWYGVWQLIAVIWPLNIPIVAIIVGVTLLYINGKTSDLT